MDKIESLNHTTWDCKSHVVCVSKNRQKVAPDWHMYTCT